MPAVSLSRNKTEDQSEMILRAATPLFAAQGFDGVTTREIARAVNLNIATVHHHVGAKQELYRKVVERLLSQELAVVEAFLEETQLRPVETPVQFRQLVYDLMDRLLDVMIAEPSRARLYLRRWLSPVDAAQGVAATHAVAFQRALTRVFERGAAIGAASAAADLPLFLRSFDWLVMGYFATGLGDPQNWRGDPFEETSVRRFRAFLRNYMCNMLDLPA